MKIIPTHETKPELLKAHEREWIYNGLDCCITKEVWEAIHPQLDPVTSRTYAFSRALQGPALEMRLRGFRIDKAKKARVIGDFLDKIDLLETNLERIVVEGVGMDEFNWRSNDQLQELFYVKLGIPPIKRAGRPTVNRAALERLEAYTVAQQIVRHLKGMRELGKKISFLKTEIDSDGRIRTSINIAGTTTGRFSSSFSEFGTGTNLQNVEELLRSVFIADKGMKLAYLDGEQAESRAVGAIEWNLFDDPSYLDACESGDLHTTVSKLTWPDLPWSGKPLLDRRLAEKPFYRHLSYRDTAKRLGHGTNYNGKPDTMALETKIPKGVIIPFQVGYFEAFPSHKAWHEYVANELYTKGNLTTLTGRRRWFFGRRDSDDVVREAIAFDPQGSVADIINTGLLQLWRTNLCQILLQVHDAVIIQYPQAKEDTILPQVLKHLKVEIPLAKGRSLVIPYGCQVGWNWGKATEDNPDGLKAYTPGDKRKRQETLGILDRPLR